VPKGTARSLALAKERLQAAALFSLGIGGGFRDQSPCKTHHPRADAMLEIV